MSELSGPKRKVIIVGGGVGGLLVACYLARDGHKVTVLERKFSYREQSLEQGQGIHLSINATRCLDALGMREEFDRFVDSSNKTKFKRYADGSIIHEVSFKNRHSFVHRSDLLNLFYEYATRAGAEVLGDETFDQIVEGEESVQLRLSSGKTLSADLIIGADGINSRARQYIPSANNIRPELPGECTFLIDVPKSYMTKDPSTSDLYEEAKVPFHFWWGPERCIIGWTMKSHELYHLQFVDFNRTINDSVRDPGESSNLVTSFSNMSDLRHRWSDFDKDVRRMLDGTDKCIKWKMAVLPDLSTWSSPSGRIILIGDAAHAFKPYAGQGAAAAIEDATVLATLISNARSSTPYIEIAEAYEHLRKPRINAIRAIIEPNANVFSMPDGEGQRQRDAKLRESTEQVEEIEPKSDYYRTTWTSQNTEEWVKGYDALAEARAFISSKWSSPDRSSSL